MEQARRPALEDYVHRIAPLGARVLINGTWYYTGPTYVLGGTLSVNGSIASSPVFVNFGGTLGGNGTVGPTTILTGGTLSPGTPSAR
jgi:fibronectin-binding autotransporter adhesin